MLAPHPLNRRRSGKPFPGAGLHQRGHVRNYPANESTVFRPQNRFLWRRRYSSPSGGIARYLRTRSDPNGITISTTTTIIMANAAASSFPGRKGRGYDSHTGSCGGGGSGGRRLRQFSIDGDVHRGISRDGRHMHNGSGEVPRNGAWNGPRNGARNDSRSGSTNGARNKSRNGRGPFLGRRSNHRDDTR